MEMGGGGGEKGRIERTNITKGPQMDCAGMGCSLVG